MGTKINSNYSDLLTFTRASKGHALRPVSYGAEQSPNATFTGNIDGWRALNAKATATAENNELKVVTTGISGAVLNSSITLEIGKIYRVSATSTSATVNHMIRLGSTSATSSDILSGTQSSVPTTFRHTFVAASDVLWIYLRNVGAGTVTWDNISVKEVTFDQPDGTLTLFEHPDNVPRVEWDADGNRLGLLVEESRTNLITYSEDFSNAYWSKLGSSSIVSTDNLAPDGTLTASEISIGSGQSYIRRSEYSISVTDHSASFWVKAASSGSATAIRLTTNNTAAWGTGVSSKLTLTSEWQRIEVKGDLNSLAPSLNLLLGNADENNAVDTDCVGNVLVWGAQLEEASFPTSYIKSNSGSTTTRSADVASIPVADFGYNQSAGSLLFEFEKNNTDGAYLLDFEGSVSSQIQVVNDGDLRVRATRSPDVTLTLESPYVASVSTRKIAYTLKSGDHSAVLDGGSAQTSASTNATSEISTLYIGSDGGADLINGHIKSIKYYPRRLTNAQLVQLTS